MAGFTSKPISTTLIRTGDSDGIGYATVSDSSSFSIGSLVNLSGTNTAQQFKVAAVQSGLVGLALPYQGTGLNEISYGLTSLAAYPSGSTITQIPSFIYSSGIANPATSKITASLLTSSNTGQIATGSLVTNQGITATFSRASTKFCANGYTQDVAQLLPNPEVFTASTWTATRCTIALDNTQTPPFPQAGGTPIYLLTDNSVSGSHRISSANFIPTNSVPYSYGVYAKAGTCRYINLTFGRQPPGAAVFDLVAGTVPFTFGSPTTSITPVGGGWFLCTITGTESSLPDNVFVFTNPQGLNAFSPSYVGSGSTVWLMAAKVVQASTLSAYSFTGGRNNAAIVSLSSNKPAIEPLGFLCESDRTNIIQNPNDLNAGIWQKQGTPVVTSNAAVAPDGTLTATFLTVDNAGSRVFQNPGGTGPYVASLWIKKVSTTGILNVQSSAGPGSGNYNIDLSLLGSGWEFVSPGHPAVTVLQGFSGGATLIQGGVGTVSQYVWGVNNIPGAYALSTISSNAEQFGDVMTITGAHMPIAAGTVDFNFIPRWSTNPNANAFLLANADGAHSNSGLQILVTTGGVLELVIANSIGFDTITSSALAWTAGQNYHIKVTWGRGAARVYRNGTLVASLTSNAHMPTTVGDIQVGSFSGANQADGWLSGIVFQSS